MDIYVSVFINNKNKNENVKDFHSFCKDKRINFKDNFGNITVSLFVGIGNEDIFSKDFNYKNNNRKDNFNNKFRNKSVSLFVGIRNNISIYIEEVPNGTAPSIQGFAKPPA